MAYITANTNSQTSSQNMLSNSTPFMDRLTHSIIKETSKSLKYYFDVKRREEAFVLSPSASTWDSVPLKARFMYGTTKEYPPLYGSCYSDNDVKICLRSIQQYRKQRPETSNDLEKQICREELNFHMRPPKPITVGNRQFSQLQLRPPRRANSSCSGSVNRALRQGLSKSTSYENKQMLNDTADILASMVKARRRMHESNSSSRQDTPAYVSRNTNPSPRQIDDAPAAPPATTAQSTDDSTDRANSPGQKRDRRTTENPYAKATSMMRKAKTITSGIWCDYKIHVTTGNCNGASTDAPIRIKLYGSRGCTEFVDLTESETHRVPFRKNQTDTFLIRTFHVGRLAGITIGHDNHDIKAGWYLSKVEIEDPIRRQTHAISCNVWLSSKSSDHKTLRDFPVASMATNKRDSIPRGHHDEVQSQSDGSTTTTERAESLKSAEQFSHKHSKHHQQTKTRAEQRQISMDSPHEMKKPEPTQQQRTQSPPKLSPPITPPPGSSTRSRPSSRKVIDSPSISRSPSPENHSKKPTPTNGAYHLRSLTPLLERPPVADGATDNLIQQSKMKTFDRDDSPTNDHPRPPARLDTRSPPPSSDRQLSVTKNDDENPNYEDDFFN